MTRALYVLVFLAAASALAFLCDRYPPVKAALGVPWLGFVVIAALMVMMALGIREVAEAEREGGSAETLKRKDAEIAALSSKLAAARSALK